MSDTSLGPRHRLGVLVPSSNTNAETSIARMLVDEPDIGAHFARFELPTDLDRAIDPEVLGDAPRVLADVSPDAVAFHGTSGSWKGISADKVLSERLSDAVGAPATTASIAVVEALAGHTLARVGLIFPGPRSIAEEIVHEYRRHDIDVVSIGCPARELSNAQIAYLTPQEIEEFAEPALKADVDAVVSIGTNLRTAYLVAEWERRFGVTIIDSATATLWQLLNLAGVGRPIVGWGRLLGTVHSGALAGGVVFAGT